MYGWGRNEAGQLGLGDSKDRMVPSLVNELTGHTVVEIATGKSHTLFLTSEGKVLAAGSNDHGQLGQGKKSAGLETPHLVQYEGPSITSVAAGADFSVLLDKEGTVWTFGLPENGQLGHNDDGKFLAKANKVSQNDNASVQLGKRNDCMQVEYRCEYSPVEVKVWVEKDMKTKEVTVLPTPKIIRISCGPQHTVAVAEDHKAYSWGFGGYGRLGHSETGNEMVPRLIASLSGKNRGVKDVVCGASFNLGICEIPGMVNMWGIYTPAKEANMYAKPISDLSGWNTRAIACNTKVPTPNLDFAIMGNLPSDAMLE